jgi:hypothetical protein
MRARTEPRTSAKEADIAPPKVSTAARSLPLRAHTHTPRHRYFDPDNSDLDEVVRLMFDPKNERRSRLFDEVRVPPPEQRRLGVAQYIEAYSKELNVSVIAIRGTDVGRMSDIIEDVKIFKEPVLLSLLSVIFPTIRFWPDNVSVSARAKRAQRRCCCRRRAAAAASLLGERDLIT